MRKLYTLLAVGIWVAVLPYLGFPHAWKEILFTASGLVIMLLSYMLYLGSKESKMPEEKTFDNFSENNFSEDNFSEREQV